MRHIEILSTVYARHFKMREGLHTKKVYIVHIIICCCWHMMLIQIIFATNLTFFILMKFMYFMMHVLQLHRYPHRNSCTVALLYMLIMYAALCSRSGWCVWLPGGSYGLGTFCVGSAAGLWVPSHLLLLSAYLGHLSHCAPLQYSRETSWQGAICLCTHQCPAPTGIPQQWLWSTG